MLDNQLINMLIKMLAKVVKKPVFTFPINSGKYFPHINTLNDDDRKLYLKEYHQYHGKAERTGSTIFDST